MDRYSLGILRALQRDARLTIHQLAEEVGLSSTPCWKRVKELEAGGVITGYTASVDRERVGLGLAIMVEVNLTQHSEHNVWQFEAAVMGLPADRPLRVHHRRVRLHPHRADDRHQALRGVPA